MLVQTRIDDLGPGFKAVEIEVNQGEPARMVLVDQCKFLPVEARSIQAVR